MGGCAAVTALEWTNPGTLAGGGTGTRLIDGIFTGIMPRTAGYNAIDYAEARPETLLVTDMLMFVGGGSGSTAGGIKVTTFAVLLLGVLAEARGRGDVCAFRRRLPPAVLRQALPITVIAMNVVVIGTLGLMLTSNAGLSEGPFERISAFATVGLSTGITPRLGDPPRAILIALRFVGRVGPLTLGVALVLRQQAVLYRDAGAAARRLTTH